MIEDPWDLIKLNPIINPPVVNEDKAYKTYQNELSHKYFEKLQPHQILNEYLNNEFQPILLTGCELYNKGTPKKAAYFKLTSEFDNKRLVKFVKNHINEKKFDIIHKTISLEQIDEIPALEYNITRSRNTADAVTATSKYHTTKANSTFTTSTRAEAAPNIDPSSTGSCAKSIELSSVADPTKYRTSQRPQCDSLRYAFFDR
jgi:hypothetical protein